jgi:hypothetical protein
MNIVTNNELTKCLFTITSSLLNLNKRLIVVEKKLGVKHDKTKLSKNAKGSKGKKLIKAKAIV